MKITINDCNSSNCICHAWVREWNLLLEAHPQLIWATGFCSSHIRPGRLSGLPILQSTDPPFLPSEIILLSFSTKR